MFTEKDIKQIMTIGQKLENVYAQIESFKRGFPELEIVAPATLGNGIIAFTADKIDRLIRYYDKKNKNLKIIKFVPASGAASRMFQTLQVFRNKNFSQHEQLKELEDNKEFNSVYNFVNNINKFAFYNDLVAALSKDGYHINTLIQNGNINVILDYLLTSKGLNYASKPKALIKFHNYDNFMRTSLGEHLAEAALYAISSDGVCRIHFTVSEEHLADVKLLVKKVKNYYTKYYRHTFEIKFSVQQKKTNTIAVDSNNEPFRETDGQLIFRPGGHGALLENLNKINADIIFVKNIDNVVPDHLKGETIKFKKLIAGYLLQLQEKIFYYLDQLDTGDITNESLSIIKKFIEKELQIKIPEHYKYFDLVEKAEYLFIILNRPLRVCGMVKNEGEPGGGPFWVQSSDETVQLQILESSQFNFNNNAHKNIFNASTHFNPVDMVLSVYDFKGKKFNLKNFTDPNTGFISTKSKDGKELKALELPGLWNGAMANWNTVFVEVPLTTFNPVKIVNDLLRDQHQ